MASKRSEAPASVEPGQEEGTVPLPVQIIVAGGFAVSPSLFAHHSSSG